MYNLTMLTFRNESVWPARDWVTSLPVPWLELRENPEWPRFFVSILSHFFLSFSLSLLAEGRSIMQSPHKAASLCQGFHVRAPKLEPLGSVPSLSSTCQAEAGMDFRN